MPATYSGKKLKEKYCDNDGWEICRFLLSKEINSHNIVMDKVDIRLFNERNIQEQNVNIHNIGPDGVGTHLCDLSSYPEILREDELRSILNFIKLPTEIRYTGTLGLDEIGNIIYKELTWNINSNGILPMNQVFYGVVVNRSNIRTYPTDIPMFKKRGDVEFDYCQESAILAYSPVRILHTSADNEWYLILAKNYTGWVKVKDVAISLKEQWDRFVMCDNFVIITENKSKVISTSGNQEIEVGMGVKIPYIKIDSQEGCMVEFLARNSNGMLDIEEGLLYREEQYSVGNLPYTYFNLIHQLLKTLNDPYDWGGAKGGRDCSSLVCELYNIFGIDIPRNASWQLAMNEKDIINLEGKSDADRMAELDRVQLGSLLVMPTHVMVYLGEYEGKYYVIHSCHAFGDETKPEVEGFLEKELINKVVITDLNTITINKQTFLQRISKIIRFNKKEK